jgi:hypothetical protein
MASGASGLLQAIEMSIETRAQRWFVHGARIGFGQHNEIPQRQFALHTKGLAGESFEFVAVHGSFCRSAGNGQTEASGCTAARSRENREVAIG